MATRNPSTLDLSYSERNVRRREKILRTEYDIALDNQARTLKQPRIMVADSFMPRQLATGSVGWRTSLYSRDKCGASFGGGTIGTVYIQTYEQQSTVALPTSGTYDVVLSDGTNTDTTTISQSAYTSTGAWHQLTIANVVPADHTRTSKTVLTITVNNFTGDIGYVYLAGVFILNDD